jgi:hypothetical protein
LATGEAPFKGATVTATLRAVADHDPPPADQRNPQVPHALSDLIARLLAKSPGDRPPSARAVADALRTAADITVSTVSVPLSMRAAPARRKRGCAVSITVTITVLTGLMIATSIGMILLREPGEASHKVQAHVGEEWRPAPAPGVQPSRVVDSKPEKAPRAEFRGSVDATVYMKVNGAGRKMRLSDAGALPLANGDQYRVAAEVEPAAYLYLFLIDTEGEANPLFPWEPGRWGSRTTEAKRSRLELPLTADKGWTINGPGSGMWTLLLVARESPWDAADDDVRRLFAGLPPQRPVQDPRSAVWFENGQVVKNDAARRAVSFAETDIEDPVLRVQRLLREQLQPHAAFTAAVSFAKQGK